MDWFSQALSDIGNAVDDAVDQVVDFVHDAAQDVGEFVNDAADTIESAAVTVADKVEDAAAAVASAVEAAAEKVGDAVDNFSTAVANAVDGLGRSAAGTADWSLNALDKFVVEPVDYVDEGVVAIDFWGDAPATGFDLGAASVGLEFGEISYNMAESFAASGSLGLVDPAWSNVEGSIEMSPDVGMAPDIDILTGALMQGSLGTLEGSIGVSSVANTDFATAELVDSGLDLPALVDLEAQSSASILPDDSAGVDPFGDPFVPVGLATDATGASPVDATFDDFTTDIVGTDTVEAEVDQVWSDIN